MFPSACNLRIFKPDEWVVLRDFVCEDLCASQGVPAKIVVPRGFITDLASIPIGLRNVLDINGLSREPAILHDYLYCTQPCTREVADEVFRHALASVGVGAIERNAYYAGVRVGGWYYWDKRARHPELRLDDFVPAEYWELNP